MLIGQHLALKTQKKGYIGLIDLKVHNAPPGRVTHTPQPTPPRVTQRMRWNPPRLYTSPLVASLATDGRVAMNGCAPAAERDAAGGVRYRGRSQHLHATVGARASH